jgi:hypothetical protein
MNILVACEKSQLVTQAFRNKGHQAFSCDLQDGEINPEWHFKRDIIQVISNSWDLVIAFPPCTHLASSGARWFKDKQDVQPFAIEFFLMFTQLRCKWAIENPIGIMSTYYRKPDQIIQPWMFGHGETKATCLWLNELPKLVPTNIVEGREHRIHNMSPSIRRGELRSRTYQGIANAMAEQWG